MPDKNQTDATQVSKNARSDRPKSPLRLLVAAQLGNVGKSTVTGTVLHPRIGGRVYSIENQNMDASRYGIEVLKFDGTEIAELAVALRKDQGNVVVDVGSGVFTAFVKHMFMTNLVKMFDYVVLVADPTDRGQKETIKTIATFLKYGVQPEKLRLVLNRANLDKPVPKQFSELCAYVHTQPGIPFVEQCAIPELEVFVLMAKLNMSWKEGLATEIDYEALMLERRNSGDDAAVHQAAERALVHEMTKVADIFLAAAFRALNIEVAPNV